MLKFGFQAGFRTILSNFVKSPIAERVKKENVILLNTQFVRQTAFFNRITKQELWKGLLSVSNAGRRKGRGKRRDNMHRNSMKSDKFGEGNIGVKWPGLNTHIFAGNKLSEIEVASKSKKKATTETTTKTVKKSRSVHPLMRGWSGTRVVGMKLGPPPPLPNQTFEGFESVVLQHKPKSVMTSTFGRRRIFSTIVAVGNSNGLVGLGAAVRFEGKIAIRLARKRASKRLLTVDLIDTHTVNHDFCSQFGKTKVIVLKKPKGYGLKCHRAIIEICKLIGIENLYAKVEGPCNLPNLLKAFVAGLLKQKTYQQIADEKKLNLVEFKEEAFNFPYVLASPKECLTVSEAKKNPVIFEEYIMGDRLLYKKGRVVPFYEKLPGWRKHLLNTLYKRNHEQVKIDLMMKYGEMKSHLAEIYPECIGKYLRKRKPKSKSE